MSDLVDPTEIERIVGAKRHPTRHLGRAVSAEQVVYILHSAMCKASGIDLRDCPYSRALDEGVDESEWRGWEDRAVALGVDRHGLIPIRVAGEQL